VEEARYVTRTLKKQVVRQDANKHFNQQKALADQMERAYRAELRRI